MSEDNCKEIENAKEKVKFYTEMSNFVFTEISKRLSLNSLGQDYLFDYLYNSNTETFPSYLEGLNVDMDRLIKN